MRREAQSDVVRDVGLPGAAKTPVAKRAFIALKSNLPTPFRSRVLQRSVTTEGGLKSARAAAAPLSVRTNLLHMDSRRRAESMLPSTTPLKAPLLSENEAVSLDSPYRPAGPESARKQERYRVSPRSLHIRKRLDPSVLEDEPLEDYVEEPGLLNVKLIKADFKCPLLKREFYCKIEIAKQSAHTKRCGSSSSDTSMASPVWDDIFNFLVENKGLDILRLFIYAIEEGGKESLLGKTEIKLVNLKHFESKRIDAPLENIDKSSILLCLRYLSLNPTTYPLNDYYKGKVVLDRYGFWVPEECQELIKEEPEYPQGRPSIGVVEVGIPFPYKAKFWQIFAMYYLELHKSPFPSGLYNNLKNQPVNPKVLMDIEKDLPRTFPLHPVFISKEGTDALRRILLAFSIRHPQIGYTQGMNFLAGFLLLLMEEELAFKVLIIIVEYFIPQYYMTDMPGLHADQMVLAILVRDELPRLHQHLQSLQLDLGVITYRWFLCLFINTLPYSTVLRIWDILFCKGTSTIIITAFALLKLMEDKLCSQSFLTTDFVDKSCLSYFNWDLLVKTMFSSPTLVKKVTGLQKAARKVKEDELKDSILKQVANSISFCNYGGVVHYHEKFTMVAIRSTIGINQFTALLPPKLSIFGTDKDILQRLFNMFDKLGYGYLTFEAYMTGLDVIFSGTDQKKIEILFKIFDLNDDGFIDATELEFILSWQNRMMKINDPHVITATIEALMQKFDEDKDGKLDKDQFIQVLKKQAFFIHLLDDLKLLQ